MKPHFIGQWCLISAIGLVATVFPLRAHWDVPLEDALKEISYPITVQRRSGRDFSGHPISNTHDSLTLQIEIDGGVAEITFQREEVLQIRFPGNGLKQRAVELAAAGERSTALLIIDRLFNQRSALLPYTGEAEAGFFAETLGLYRQADRNLESVARAEVLQPYLIDPMLRLIVEKETLLSYHRLGFSDEARLLAQQVIEREGREPESAFAAIILAQIQINEGNGDAALFTLLHPIVFSGPRPIEGLDLCYAFVIELAISLERPGVARCLQLERDQRGLGPPATWEPLTAPDFSPLTLPPHPS